MPGFMAREKCPQLVFLPVRFDLYRAESQKIREILRSYTPRVEPLSLDEAYLDVSGCERFAWELAKEMRARIFAETGLTASAGVASNKMLAKIASDWRKPNGQFAILPEQVADFMRGLPVRKLWGVGPKSADRFAAQGIQTCGDLQRLSLAELAERHGKWGEELYRLCRGEDDRAVEPHRPRKSLSNESTFAENLTSLAACRAELEKLVADLLDELRRKAADRAVRKAFVKLKFADFTRTSRECVCGEPTPEVFQGLLEAAHARSALSVRLLGAGVRFADETSLDDAPVQLDLFAGV
jgi:DNA polymerase-4